MSAFVGGIFAARMESKGEVNMWRIALAICVAFILQSSVRMPCPKGCVPSKTGKFTYICLEAKTLYTSAVCGGQRFILTW